MKKLLSILLIILPFFALAQQLNLDSLRQALKYTTADSVLYDLNSALYFHYEENNVDSALYYSDQMLIVARRSNQKLVEANSLNSKAYQYRNIGLYGKSLQCLNEALTILENPEIEKNTTWLSDSLFTPHRLRLWILSITHHMYALLMESTSNSKEEIFHYKEEMKISELVDRKAGLQLAYMNLGNAYLRLNMLDSALAYSEKANSMAEKNNFKYYNGWNLGTLGDIYYKMRKDSLALKYYYAGIQNSKELKNLGSLTSNYSKITKFYLAKKNVDSSLYYAKINFVSVKSLGTNSNVKSRLADSYKNLFGAYNLTGQRDSAFKYLNLAMVYKDSVFNDRLKNLAEFQSLTLSQQKELQDLKNEKIEIQNKIRLYTLIAALVVFMIIALLLYRNNRNRKKANQLLHKQNKIILAENERRAEELEEARRLQLAMLPKDLPAFEDLELAVFMETATEVGGDYYDFSRKEDGSINIAISDATGHGMKAGTLVTMMKSLFAVNSESKDIEEFFTTSNNALKNSNLKRMMAGFAMLNISDHKAKYINAGMPSIYHYIKNKKEIDEVKQHNLPLGAMKLEKYETVEIELNSGDVLIMMTDGFPELHNQADELFGYERVYSAFEKAVEKEPEEIIKHLYEEGNRWRKEKELLDDVTFVVIKVK